MSKTTHVKMTVQGIRRDCVSMSVKKVAVGGFGIPGL